MESRWLSLRIIKHSKSKLTGYIRQAKNLFHCKFSHWFGCYDLWLAHLSITGSLDGEHKPEVNAKTKVPREIANAPMNTSPSRRQQQQSPTPPRSSSNLSPIIRPSGSQNPNLSLSSSSFSATSSSPAPIKRFQRSPFFDKKISVTPRVCRIPSVSGALDLGTPAFESPTGP